MVTVLLTVLIFGVLILVHELGHFIACRIFGVKVNEFAIGMGPRIFSVESKKSKTVYSLRAFPIGGFNSIEDGINNDEEQDENAQPLPPSEDSFAAKPVWQRMIIIASGSFLNLVLGFIIMTVVVFATNKYASTTIYDVYDVSGEQPVKVESYQGLMSGDKVIEVCGRNIYTGEQLAYNIFNFGGGKVDMTVIRNGKEIVLKDVQFPTETKQGVTYGVRNFRVYTEEKNFVNTVKQSFWGGVNYIVQVFDSLVGMITGKYGIQHVSGPIGVGEAIGKAAKVGVLPLLSITVLLAMNLGVFNLLPIPGLDGGKFVFLLAEAIARRPIPRKFEEYATMIGMALLFGLVFVVMFKDIFTIFR